MRHPPRHAPSFIVVLLLALTGCMSLGRDSPPLEQYVLGGGRGALAAGETHEAAGMRIGMRRLDLAPYLATPAIVTRRGAHRIIVSEFHRWGEELGEGINRAVASHVADARAVRAVDVAPWAVRAQHDVLVQLRVARFEGVADSLAVQGEVHVLASWEILHPQEGVVLARGETDHRQHGWTVGDYAGLVALLEDGLGVIADDLVSCLGRLRSASPGPGVVSGDGRC
jgi:uncharacterized protein